MLKNIKLKKIVLIISLSLLLAVAPCVDVLRSHTVFAATATPSATSTPPQCYTVTGSGATSGQTVCTPADNCGAQACTSNNGGQESSITANYLNPIINFLAIGVGLVIVTMIVVGGIQFITSAGDPNGVAAAKNRIRNALIALLTFGLLWAFLQWVLPNKLF